MRGAHFNTQESTRCLDSGLVLEIKRVFTLVLGEYLLRAPTVNAVL